jgi:hypothetical protein
LQTSDDINQRSGSASSAAMSPSSRNGFRCSTKATWRHELAPSAEVLS